MNEFTVDFYVVGDDGQESVSVAIESAKASVVRQITEAGENPEEYVLTLMRLPVIDQRNRYELRARKRASEAE